MKPKIILATIAAFAAACNKAISASDQAVELRDITLQPDGRLSALLLPISGRNPNTAGSLHEVSVLKGSVSAVEEELANALDESRHVGALKLIVTGTPVEEEDPAPASAKKKKSGVLVVLGAFQP
jgi:hypothetical protein